MSAYDDLRETLVTVVHELFRDHGIVPSQAEPLSATADGVFISTIGFAAEGARGNVVVIAERSAVDALRPVEVEQNDELTLCDVLGEYANMIAGRFKNRMLPRGVAFLLGTPTNAVVDRLRLQKPMTPLGLGYLHVCDLRGGRLDVRFDATVDTSFVLADARTAPEPELAEGDLMMF